MQKLHILDKVLFNKLVKPFIRQTQHIITIFSISVATLPAISHAATILPISSESGITIQGGFSNTTTPITSPTITDNDIATGVVFYGEEAVNTDSLLVDYAPYVIFDFDASSPLIAATLNISISSKTNSSSCNNMAFRVWNNTIGSTQEFHSTRCTSDISDGIDSYSFTFTDEGNTGNYGSDINLFDIKSADGLITFLAYGPYHSSLDNPGLAELYLNEVNLTITPVPIPPSFWLLGSSLLGLLGMSIRRHMSTSIARKV